MAGGAPLRRGHGYADRQLHVLETALSKAGAEPSPRRGAHIRACLAAMAGDFGASMLESRQPGFVLEKIDGLTDAEAEGVAELLQHVLRVGTGGLSPPGDPEWRGFSLMQSNMAGLVEIGRWSKRWLRPLEWWRPDGSRRPELFQLLRYLFVRWPVPEFLDGVWMWPECEAWCEWYVRMGAGGPAWPAPVPWDMTRRQLHFFLKAPPECRLPVGLVQAGVWADARSMGASEDEARRLMGSRIGRLHLLCVSSTRPFGLSVMRFVLDHPEIAERDLDPLLDYIHDVKYGHRLGLKARPQFNLAGRSPEKLLQEMRHWEAERARRREAELDAPFPSSGLEPWSEDGWQTVSVDTPRKLAEEGARMRHCVSNHLNRCGSGVSYIWSLRRREGGEMKRALTVEVMNGLITQVRGFANRAATDEELAVLERWAGARGLKLLASASARRGAPMPAPERPTLWRLAWRLVWQIVLRRPARRLI